MPRNSPPRLNTWKDGDIEMITGRIYEGVS
jgi:hypothetical protein